MKLIAQPEGSSLCGQCCVAMAAGVSLKRAIEVVGHRRGTWTPEIVRALRELGVDCDDRFKRIGPKTLPILPRRAFVSITTRNGDDRASEMSHWLLTWDGNPYDPSGACPDDLKGWRITGFLTIHA